MRNFKAYSIEHIALCVRAACHVVRLCELRKAFSHCFWARQKQCAGREGPPKINLEEDVYHLHKLDLTHNKKKKLNKS